MKFEQTDGGCNMPEERANDKDCTVRALAIAGGMDYDTAYLLMKQSGRPPLKCGNMRKGLNTACEKGYLRAECTFTGLWDTLTFAEFQRRHTEGRYIVRVKAQHFSYHVFAVIDGVQKDTSRNHGSKNVLAVWRVVPVMPTTPSTKVLLNKTPICETL